MDLDKPVSEIMTSEVIFASLDNKFTQVKELFEKFNLHHLPIVDDDQNIIGIISTNDMIKCFSLANKLESWNDEAFNETFKLNEIMTPDPVHIAPQASIRRAIQIMNDNMFQALPIVELGKVVGILTLKDLINYLADFEE